MEINFRPREGYRDRWEILIDGEKWRDVHRAIFGRKPVFPSLSSDQDYQAVFDAFEYRRVKGYVLWRLSTQSYHSEQLAKLLQDRLVQMKTIQRVLQEYQETGLLNDELWVQNFIRTQQKRYSLRLILSKLRTKGLSADTLQQLAKDWHNPEEEVEAIRLLIQRRYRSKDLSQYKEKQKVIAALLRKGYAFDQIHEALKMTEL